ncbi:hypothetical protein GCM10009826_06630 [Humibacillus xanthopallidus]
MHPVPGCFEMAVRRKAFGRALRLQAAVDVSAVAQHLDIQHAQQNGVCPAVGRHQSEISQRTNKAG